MKSLFEQMGGTYTQVGDYLLPDLALPEKPAQPIGKYGLLRKSYLEENRPGLYSRLVLSGKLYEHLAEVEQTCRERMEFLCKAMAEKEGVNKALKAADQMEWVRRMNNIHNRAEEIVLNEIVYAL